jgi:hypothetical protein
MTEYIVLFHCFYFIDKNMIVKPSYLMHIYSYFGFFNTFFLHIKTRKYSGRWRHRVDSCRMDQGEPTFSMREFKRRKTGRFNISTKNVVLRRKCLLTQFDVDIESDTRLTFGMSNIINDYYSVWVLIYDNPKNERPTPVKINIYVYIVIITDIQQHLYFFFSTLFNTILFLSHELISWKFSSLKSLVYPTE